MLTTAIKIAATAFEKDFDKGISSVLKNFDKAYSDSDGENYYKETFE